MGSCLIFLVLDQEGPGRISPTKHSAQEPGGLCLGAWMLEHDLNNSASLEVAPWHPAGQGDCSLCLQQTTQFSGGCSTHTDTVGRGSGHP